MLTDAQAKLVMLVLLSAVLAGGAYGFVRALRTGSVVVRTYPGGFIRVIVRRDENPRRFRRLMIGWAILLLLCVGLYTIPLFAM